MRPSSQLSSMKRRIDVWSMIECETVLGRTKGEITSSGRRGP